MASRIHVAVGVLIDSKGCVLLTRRMTGTHLAGQWEFPGGKVEENESVQTALARELGEELGIQIGETVPLMVVSHDYGEEHVLLDVHQVKDWNGEPYGAEGQPLAWVDASSVDDFQVPEANRKIVSRVKALLA